MLFIDPLVDLQRNNVKTDVIISRIISSGNYPIYFRGARNNEVLVSRLRFPMNLKYGTPIRPSS